MDAESAVVSPLPGALQARLAAARAAARALRRLDVATRRAVLHDAARRLVEQGGAVLAENAADLAAHDALGESGRGPAFRDRLLLDAARLGRMGEGLRQVAAMDDPVGEVVEARTLANGLRLRRVRSPLGVILLIFESRPDVAVEAFSLAFMAGNALVLRGGRESMHTTAALYRLLGEALAAHRVPDGALLGITDPDRGLTRALLADDRSIDVVVPRGGPGLIEFVVEHARMPVIKNDRGLCHVYVHDDADLAMAVSIVDNAKTQRPGVCNAMETLLVHRAVAARLLPALHERISGPARAAPVRWFADGEVRAALPGRPHVEPATEGSFDTEYLDLALSARVVPDLSAAIDHIERHGSRHSECIVTASDEAARRFQEEVDAACVYRNASTRFTDGFSLGLGGELGISTQKLHVRGPVGLQALTSVRWVFDGDGQCR